MPTRKILKHGFKAKAERLAEEYRKKLNLHACAPLCAFKLAQHLEIPVYKATDILNEPADIALLSGKGGVECEWSALTMVTKANNRIIIHNPFHSEARQQSDTMHELAHIICEHKRDNTEHAFEVPFGMRHFDELQEEEAKCLGSTLQVAKPCLFWSIKRRMTYEEIASHFNASVDMVKYRVNMTGLAKRMNSVKGV